MSRRVEKSDDELKGTAVDIAFLRCTYASFSDPLLRYDTRALDFEGRVLEALPSGTSFGFPQTLQGARQFAARLESGASDHWRGMTYNLARARVMDETILSWASAVSDNKVARQLVILGAGLDFRAERHSEALARIKVFELDLPPMIALRKRLMESILATAGSTSEVLKRRGFDSSLPSLFVWEGVTYYLKPEAVSRTLALIRSSCAPGSQLIFDYLDVAVVGRSHSDPSGEQMRRTFATFEPLIWGLDFEIAEAFAESHKFVTLRHWKPQQLEKDYLRGKRVRLAGSPFFAILLVGVPA